MDENRKLLIAALVILLGANTGSLVNAYNPSFRADSFTNSDALELKEELADKITELRIELIILRSKVADHDRHHKEHK